MSESKLSLKILQVLHGDAFRIRFLESDEKYHNIFIDGGFARSYRATLRHETEQLLKAHEKVDLFVITHTDRDHISGVLSFVTEFGELDLVDRYWFNYSNLETMVRFPSDKISIGDGVRLRNLLMKRGQLSDVGITTDLGCIELAGSALTILSPTAAALREFQQKWSHEEIRRDPSLDRIVSTKNDYGIPIETLAQNHFHEDEKLENGVSISFLFQLGRSSILFLADSHPSKIVQSLRQLGYSAESKLRVDYVKLAHHGSKSNTSNELLALIDCTSFVISANGTNRYGLPHKETLSRILMHPNRNQRKHIKFIFNYDNEVIRNIFTESDYSSFNFSCLYPSKGTNGHTIFCEPY